MSTTRIERRAAAVLCATGLLAMTGLAVAPHASATTLYACVKRGGSARVFAHKPRCRHGETRLAWNTRGPVGAKGTSGRNGAAGKTGANGKEGAAGANGAVAGFSAKNPAFVEIPNKEAVTLVHKTLPAGSYIISAKTNLEGVATEAGISVGIDCELLSGANLELDGAFWTSPLGEVEAEYLASTAVSMQAAVTLGSSTEISLLCEDDGFSKKIYKESAGPSVITAVQTSKNS